MTEINQSIPWVHAFRTDHDDTNPLDHEAERTYQQLMVLLGTLQEPGSDAELVASVRSWKKRRKRS